MPNSIAIGRPCLTACSACDEKFPKCSRTTQRAKTPLALPAAVCSVAVTKYRQHLKEILFSMKKKQKRKKEEEEETFDAMIVILYPRKGKHTLAQLFL